MSNQSNCDLYIELLDAYLDNELDVAERASVDAHLAECGACAREVRRMGQMTSGLQALPQMKSRREIDFSFLDAAAPASSSASSSAPNPASNPAPALISAQVSAAASVPIDCVPFIELLDAFHDGELNNDEQEQVQKHLSQCAPCMGRVKEIEAIVFGIKSLPKVVPSRDIVGNIDFEALNTRAEVNCADTVLLLDAYHDGELDREEKVRVENHLTGCADCQNQLLAIRQLVEGIKSLPLLQPSQDIVGSIEFEKLQPATLQAAPAVVPTSPPPKVLFFQRKVQIGIASVAAAAVALVVSLNFKPVTPDSSTNLATNTANPVIMDKAPLTGSEGTKPAQSPPLTPDASTSSTENKISTQNNHVIPNETVKQNASAARSSASKTVVAKNEIASRPQAVEPEVKHEALPNDVDKNSDTANEVALMPDSASNATGAEALGIATDEDGLYDIKL